jgi:hypothetical protein
MKKLSALIVAFGLAVPALSSAAPVEMTEEQMDKVAGGALINVIAFDLVDVEQNKVAVSVPVNAAVGVGVLGTAITGAAQGQPGRIRQ